MLDLFAICEEALHWRRSNGLFDLEGRMADRKPHDFTPWQGDKHFPIDDPVHDMGAHLVYDRDMTIHVVAIFTEAAPYDACLPRLGAVAACIRGPRAGLRAHTSVQGLRPPPSRGHPSEKAAAPVRAMA